MFLLLLVNCFRFGFVDVSFSLPLLFSSFLVWWLTLVFYLDSFYFFVFVSIVDFQFVVPMRFCYSIIYTEKLVFSCWSFNFKCISDILHLYLPLLTISGFDIILQIKCSIRETLVRLHNICNILQHPLKDSYLKLHELKYERSRIKGIIKIWAEMN